MALNPYEYQFVEEEVTRQKFNEELIQFEALKAQYRNDGVLLMDQTYPNLHFAFAAPALKPLAIVFAVRINFVNYDVLPLSVKFVNPLNFQVLMAEHVQTQLLRKIEGSELPLALVQAQSDRIPFFCIPGVREYHLHPRHKGDFWFLHRKRGEGGLCFILNNLQLYGLSAIQNYTARLRSVSQGNMIQVIDLPMNNLSLIPKMDRLPT